MKLLDRIGFGLFCVMAGCAFAALAIDLWAEHERRSLCADYPRHPACQERRP